MFVKGEEIDRVICQLHGADKTFILMGFILVSCRKRQQDLNPQTDDSHTSLSIGVRTSVVYQLPCELNLMRLIRPVSQFRDSHSGAVNRCGEYLSVIISQGLFCKGRD